MNFSIIKAIRTHKYNLLQCQLDALGQHCPAVVDCCNWWSVYPFYGGYSLCGLNLSETGHSTMKPSQKLMLILPCGKACVMLVHDKRYKQAVDNPGCTSGKG